MEQDEFVFIDEYINILRVTRPLAPCTLQTKSDAGYILEEGGVIHKVDREWWLEA
jgi:hypothetical protein